MEEEKNEKLENKLNGNDIKKRKKRKKKIIINVRKKSQRSSLSTSQNDVEQNEFIEINNKNDKNKVNNERNNENKSKDIKNDKKNNNIKNTKKIQFFDKQYNINEVEKCQISEFLLKR
ncbi:hypothetical protein PGSY75_0706300 [Plasmodium gaboni]|uniref:Uncharacterized protein n=1 Tax=Plasmodium gaboni TaxID=647221 RepID=A0A151LQ53_9APIC|nr:hypothetical protein PGSY75_0706300 [Plasmodium gaboni]KYO01229.1 hypothetical protein PGSY75_0706300 [Plasmodium gaboni]SOV21867.1 conserved Plasmodium protein, unknown function [Plasmodium sp. DRC-Itaito]